jgi:hypothetical protein
MPVNPKYKFMSEDAAQLANPEIIPEQAYLPEQVVPEVPLPEESQPVEAQPALEYPDYSQTTFGRMAQERGNDPRSLIAAFAQFGGEVGNLRGRATKSTSGDFLAGQLSNEQAQRQEEAKQQVLLQRREDAKRALTQQAQRLAFDKLKLTEQATQRKDFQNALFAQQTQLQANALANKEQLATKDTYAKTSEGALNRAAYAQNKVVAEEKKDKSTGFRNSSELRKEYQNDTTTKNSKLIKDTYNKIESVLTNPSPGGDMGGIFMFMKMLDPASTVREGEYKSAAEATGALDRMSEYATKVQTGTKLTESQRVDFKNIAKKFFNAQMKEQERVNSAYRTLSTKNNIDPEDLMLLPTNAGGISSTSSAGTSGAQVKSVNDLPAIK